MSIDHELRGALPTISRPEIAAASRSPKWRRLPSTRLILGCLILVAGGFAGGVVEARHTGATTASAARVVPATGGGAAPAGQRANTGGAATVGTVKLVDGSTIYLTTTDGNVVRVSTTGKTTLSLSAAGKASDLKAGATIVVTGTTDASGTIKATAVTQSRANTVGAPIGGFPTG